MASQHILSPLSYCAVMLRQDSKSVLPSTLEPGSYPTWRGRCLHRSTLSFLRQSRAALAAAGFSVLLFAGQASAEIWNPAADYIITGASVVTMGENPRAEAIAVRDGVFIGVGTEEEVMTLKGEGTRIIDASGASVVPGLQDSHLHPVSLGRAINFEAELIDARTVNDVVAALTDLKQRTSPDSGTWMVGARWHPAQFETLFTRWDIDAVAPENPVHLRRYRGVAVNTAALELMGIKDEDPATWPAWWLKDPDDFTDEDTIYRVTRKLTIDGQSAEYDVPTGVFSGSKATALVTVAPPKPTFDEDVESVRLGSIELQKVGITSIIDAASRNGYTTSVFQAARDRGVLGVKVPSTYIGIFFKQDPDDIAAVAEGLKISNLGDEWVRLRGAKFYSDGGPSSRGSWLGQPYEGHDHGSDSDGAEKGYGLPVVEDDAKREAQYRVLVDRGWSLHTHATGDAAMLQAVRLYKKLQDEILAEDAEADLRWSIEHANLPLESPEIMEIMSKYGIIASVQPIMINELGGGWVGNIGAERMSRSIPVASYIKNGVLVVAGSDYSITPFDPWLGMHAMMTRTDKKTGEVYGIEERVDLWEAMKTYTINGAYFTHEEDMKGSIEIGKAADFVVLDIADLEQANENPELLKSMSGRVLATVIDGQARYQREGSDLFR